jgi:hypothetical protein
MSHLLIILIGIQGYNQLSMAASFSILNIYYSLRLFLTLDDKFRAVRMVCYFYSGFLTLFFIQR